MRNKNEFPRYSTLWQEYFMNILFRLCHKNHLSCIKIKPTIFVKMADDIPFDDSRLLCNPNGGDFNVVDVSTLEAQMIDSQSLHHSSFPCFQAELYCSKN